jgi:hypothetical protein
MNLELKYIIFMYIFILILLYIWKPNIFDLNDEKNRKKKVLYLFSLIIIIAIISFYIKVLIDWFL